MISMGRRIKRVKVGHSSSRLTDLPQLPVAHSSILPFPGDFSTEVWLEILEKVELWDLFSLYWTSKTLQALLKRPMCTRLWEDALRRLHDIDLPRLTGPKGRDLALLLLHPICQMCGIQDATRDRLRWEVGVRICVPCAYKHEIFVHARDVSDSLGEVMDLVCYIVPHFTRRYAFDSSPSFLRNDLLEISRWAAETRPCGPDALKVLIEDLHKEVLRIVEYDKMCNRFAEMERQRCSIAKNNYICRILKKMEFPDPEALREFIVDPPRGVKNRRPLAYLRHLSAQEWKDDFGVLKGAIAHVEAQRLQHEYGKKLREMGSNPEFENRRISRSMVKCRQKGA
ncbi:hypothetical protein BJ322DRAFT_1031773 [Thelephora terrestris]|uniref:F-box domain-containing protein n=1 Tax=Thelephora terrestris TaxID=56493 RepID=A0A9P6HQV4_9AGAM|nr:hypothetical protein BJ322DRAFT_1031773 [Thelephora terrestris]